MDKNSREKFQSADWKNGLMIQFNCYKSKFIVEMDFNTDYFNSIGLWYIQNT